MTVESLIEMLTLALPYVEESEEFNKPHKRTLSKEIRAAITRSPDQQPTEPEPEHPETSGEEVQAVLFA